MDLFDILLYIASKSEKEYNDKKYENERNNRFIFNNSQILTTFIATLIDKKVKTPKYEDLFVNNKRETKVDKQSLLLERVNRFKKKKGVD
ncbi:MAG: hypothetical protein R3Y60_01885 [bacterium]